MINFNPILPELFIGSCPRKSLDISYLKDELKIGAVMNVQTDEDFKQSGVNWKGLEKAYVKNKLPFIRHPIPDFDEDALHKHLVEAAKRLDDLLTENDHVYLHCTDGMDRSPTIAVTWLCLYQNQEIDKAITDIKKIRPVSRPKRNMITQIVEQARTQAQT